MDTKAPEGKLGVLIPGLGAVSTTFIAGVDAILNGRSAPIGSLTQMATIRLGKRTENNNPRIKDFVPLAELKDLVFGAWDIFEDDGYQAASKAGVLTSQDLDAARGTLESVKPMKAVFDHEYVKNIDGPNKKAAATKMLLAEMLMDDIKSFRAKHNTTREVMMWCASTEVYIEPTDIHSSLEKFEAALLNNDPGIAPSMIYAYAALKSGVPFLMGAPNLTVDIPAIQELAMLTKMPIAGKDFKTGQTLMKTILAPGLKSRMLGVEGWFSTNILGNRDGEVLDDPMAFKTKEVSKKGALDYILQADSYPDLYKDLYHKVRINYYPPRGDAKEGWDNIDIFGWMGYKMQIKVDFLCRDSILAAPIVLDLVLFADLALRSNMRGIQEWLSFYFKAPMVAPGLYPEHDIFIQLTKLKNTLRWMMGEELITHVGHEYYDSYE
ncbi:MAG: inositol-3-phosphate synthase [Candidatus Marinimicrobia bacterium]|nr:inositol-3-phosphate synthase [Candidatus Neomarinimicrobiota bacterium]